MCFYGEESLQIMTKVRQDLFDNTVGYVRGRPFWVMGLWQVAKSFFFITGFPWPSGLKCYLLRVFGAKIGRGVIIKPRVSIHLPWKLTLHDWSLLGEEAYILNMEPVEIGAHACVSQRAFLCTGNHDYKKPTVPYRNRPIFIGSGAWVGASVFVAPGVNVGSECVISACSVVMGDLPAAMVCGGNPCVPIKARWD